MFLNWDFPSAMEETKYVAQKKYDQKIKVLHQKKQKKTAPSIAKSE